MRHPSLQNHSSPIGHGWELSDGHCRPIRYTIPALPANLPSEESADEMIEDDDQESVYSDSDDSYMSDDDYFELS